MKAGREWDALKIATPEPILPDRQVQLADRPEAA